MKDLFRGELVRFTFEEPETRAKAEVRWQRDTEFVRLADGDPSHLSSEKKIKEWFDQQPNEVRPQSAFLSPSALWRKINTSVVWGYGLTSSIVRPGLGWASASASFGAKATVRI
jgi:hypothetical protein